MPLPSEMDLKPRPLLRFSVFAPTLLVACLFMLMIYLGLTMPKRTFVVTDMYTLRDKAHIQVRNGISFLAPATEPYNLVSDHEVSMGQAQLIRKLFKEKKNGFFIECGALDGETRSNTLSIEKDLGWDGLLIEGSPNNVEKLIRKHRKAWVLPNCISIKTVSFVATFKNAFNVGKIVEEDNKSHKSKSTSQVPCYPLYDVLLALNRTHVDYFSLDVEGHEFAVLKTIPFDKLDITALSVEFRHVGEMSSSDSKEDMVTFMKRNGYEVRAEVTHYNDLANDYIFVKKGFHTDVKLYDIRTKAP